MSNQNFYMPFQEKAQPGQKVADRKRLFADLNDLARARGAWLTSIPGATEVTMECLPSSSITEELRKLGYVLKPDGEGQRMIPHAITTAVATESSTKPTYVTSHAGLVAVERYTFALP